MENDFITDYIIHSVSSDILRRGRDLFDERAVSIISNDGSTIEAKVKGKTGKYHTHIYNADSMHIEAECTCPYDWGGYCKHIVALGYEATHNRRTNGSVTPKNRKQRKKNQPLQLEGFENMGTAFQARYVNKYYTFPMPKINRIEFMPGGGLYFDYIKPTFGDTKKHIIKLYKEKDGYYINCSCGEFKDEDICPYESYTLSMLYEKQIREIHTYLQPDALKIIANQTLKDFGLGDKYNSLSNFDIYLDGEFQLVVIPINDLDGFRTVQHPYFNDLIEKLNTSNQGHYKHLHKKKPNYYGLGFHFSFDHNKGILITPLRGKLSKNQRKYSADMEVFTEMDSSGFDISENETKALLLCQQLDGARFRSEETKEAEDLYRLNIVQQIMKLLKEHPRTFITANGGTTLKRNTLENVRLHTDPVCLNINIDMKDDFIDLDVMAKDQDTQFPLSDCDSSLQFLLAYEGELFALKSVEDIALLRNDVFHKKIKFPIQQTETLKSGLLPALARNHTIVFPESNPLKLSGINVKTAVKSIYIDESESHLFFTPVVEYNSKYKVRVLASSTVLDEKNGATQILYRDQDDERAFIDFLAKFHPDWEDQKDSQEGFALSVDQVLSNGWFFNFYSQLKDQNIEILGLKDLKKFRYSPLKASVGIKVRSGQDWFEADIACAFGNEQISIKDLSSAIKNDQNYIELSDGSNGMLPVEWLEKLKSMLLHSKMRDNKLLMSKHKFTLVDELFEDIEDEELLAEISEKKHKLISFKNIEHVNVPESVQAELRDYQKEGLNWLNFLDEFSFGGILADDMGLGKTLQILSFLSKRKESHKGNNLIIVPTSLIFNWENEINKFCPNLSYLVYHSNERIKDHKQFADFDLIITSYGVLTRDIKLLQKHRFDYIILDESQAIKNPTSQRYKAACLLKGNNRLTMTGTPIENNTFDLYAQMSFVNPGLLGNATHFRKQFSNPIDKDRNPDAAKELNKIINPFIIRRTKEQVAQELPDKTEDVIYCSMEDEQRKIYDAYRNKYRDYLLKKIKTDGIEKSKIYILEGLTKLRQICDSPQLIKDETYGNHSIKINEIMRHITSKTANHKIIVFSQFVSMLKLIEKELISEDIYYEYLDGSTSPPQRQMSVENFQNNESCRVFLISIKAGGTGLNLTAADYVYLMDPWWNPAVENQAIDRCYRIGQDKKVFAYRMICKNTIEDKILHLQQKKRSVANQIIQTEDAFFKNISISDLEGLFE